MVKPLDILGKRFGSLVAIEEVEKENGCRKWKLKCDCGNFRVALQKSFCSGGTMKSCGCQSRQEHIHGLANAPEYRHWINMISRCENKNTPSFYNYGGRGIRVCERWRTNVENFYVDMGPRPSPRHSLDRVDVNGNYEPNNCRWALPKIQARNTRANRFVEVNGWSMTLAEAVEMSPLPYNTVLYRLKRGWSLENALSRPARKGRRP